jgi:5-deoxy-glucuronate isomerase
MTLAHDQLIRFTAGFEPGFTPVTRAGEAVADVGFDFGILRLGAGQGYEVPAQREGALLLMEGDVELRFDGCTESVTRRSLFDADPVVLHFPAGTAVAVRCRGETDHAELALVQAENDRSFEPRLFDRESMVEPSEHRGRGLLDDAAYRIVRTVFDRRNRPRSNLVLGEVVTFPGRWSSYPPHHHPQPEIYHYRFTEPQGFGHGELGDEVLKVRQHDTVKILDGQDHAQVAAPGYGMYYIWAIRHLPGQPYTVPEFTEEHRWLNDPGAATWRPAL